MPLQNVQFVLSGTVSGLLVAFFCTPFDVVKNYSQFRTCVAVNDDDLEPKKKKASDKKITRYNERFKNVLNKCETPLVIKKTCFRGNSCCGLNAHLCNTISGKLYVLNTKPFSFINVHNGLLIPHNNGILYEQRLKSKYCTNYTNTNNDFIHNGLNNTTHNLSIYNSLNNNFFNYHEKKILEKTKNLKECKLCNKQILSTQTRCLASSKTVAQYILHQFGSKALWTGLSPAILVLCLSNCVFFSFYEPFLNKGISPFWASIEARFYTLMCIAPFEYARTKMQATLERSKTFTGLLNESVNKNGFFSLWRGILPSLIRDMPFTAIYWQMNYFLLRYIKKNVDNFELKSNFQQNFLYPAGTAAFCSVIACAVTHPFDIVKTHIQASEITTGTTKYPTIYWKRPYRTVKTVRMLSSYFGSFQGLTVGLLPRLLKIVPSCSIVLGTVEFTKSYFATI